MAVVHSVTIGLGEHLYRTPKAECPDELGFGLHSCLVFIAQVFDQIETFKQAVDPKHGIEKITIDTADIRSPSNGLSVENGFQVVVVQGLICVVSSQLIDQLHVTIVQVGHHVIA